MNCDVCFKFNWEPVKLFVCLCDVIMFSEFECKPSGCILNLLKFGDIMLSTVREERVSIIKMGEYLRAD